MTSMSAADWDSRYRGRSQQYQAALPPAAPPHIPAHRRLQCDVRDPLDGCVGDRRSSKARNLLTVNGINPVAVAPRCIPRRWRRWGCCYPPGLDHVPAMLAHAFRIAFDADTGGTVHRGSRSAADVLGGTGPKT